jgi:hypothetical protein
LYFPIAFKLFQDFMILQSNVEGTLPTEIGQLSSLKTPDLAAMFNLRGGIPSQFVNLSSLVDLTLTDVFDDEILFPSFVDSLPKSLLSLHLVRSRFNSTIPSGIWEFHHLTSLVMIALDSLTGTLPSEIGLMTRLQSLRLEGLHLVGSLPSEIGQLIDLTSLNVGCSESFGQLPTEINQLSKLTIEIPINC